MAAVSEPITDIAVDAHYYDGGLKIVRLAGGAVQPAWVPADAGDLVGLHEAFKLEPGDRVVEITRLRSGTRCVTWIANYRRSHDVSFGDRSNYAGVGVWLLNQVVHGPDFLLDGLDTLSRSMADAGAEATATMAAQFIAAENLPRDLSPLAAMPPGLSGWTFSQDLLPAKELYEVVIDGGGPGSWQPVSDHILRMTLLPGPTPAHARSLILVRPRGEATTVATAGCKPLPGGLSSDLARALPEALADQQRRVATLAQEQRALTGQRDRLAQELAEARASAANAGVRIGDLERQLDASDRDGRLKAMGGTLARIDEQTRASAAVLTEVLDYTRTIDFRTGKAAARSSAARSGTGGGDPSTDDDTGGARAASGTPRHASTPSRSPAGPDRFGWLSPRPSMIVWTAGGIVAALAVAVLLVMIYRGRQSDAAMTPTEAVPVSRSDVDQPRAGFNRDDQTLPSGRDGRRYRSRDGSETFEIDRRDNYSEGGRP